MINYIEKGYGLHEAIRKAGHWLREESGVWVSSDDAAVQAIIDSYAAIDPLIEIKQAKCAEVSAKAKRVRDRVIASISAGEMASWPIKRAEAALYGQTGNPADCPSLIMEATHRGITLDDLVLKVNSNAARFMWAETVIGGTDGKHRDAIGALTTIADVTAYDFSAGWPEV